MSRRSSPRGRRDPSRGKTKRAAAFLVAPCVVVVVLLLASSSRAEGEAALFADGSAALGDGRAGDAVADFEALADRGVVDPVASYDRGLAYAARVRASGEQPGDLGRAAQGFEEARALTRDASLARDATEALRIVRAEVARRRARAGDPADVDQGPGFLRALVRLVPEDGWAVLALAASVALAASLFLRGVLTSRQGRAGAAIGWAVSAPLLVLGAAMALAARSDRLNLKEGVVVTSSARPADEKGITVAGATTIPEAARVDILGSKPGWARVSWGGVEAWVPATAVRPIARAEEP